MTQEIADGIEFGRDITKVDPAMLSFRDLALGDTGEVVSIEAKKALREKLGYCLDCPGHPVLLFDVKRSRLNPLWFSKKPRTEEGVCGDGKCLRCETNKSHKHRRGGPRRKTSERSLGASSTTSACSVQSSRSGVSTNRSSRQLTMPRMHRSSSAMELGTSCPSTPVRFGSKTARRGSIANCESWRSLRQSQTTTKRRSSTGVGHLYDSSRSPCSPYQKSPKSNSSLSSQSITERRRIENISILSESEHSRMSQRSVLSMESTDSLDKSEHSFAQSLIGHSVSCDNKVPERQVEKVEEIKALLHDISSSDDDMMFAEIVAETMKLSASKCAVQIACLEAIANRFEDHLLDATTSLCNGLHQEVVRSMSMFPKSLGIQGMGCLAVWAMARNDQIAEALVEEGICARIKKCLSCHVHDATTISRALMALRALTFTNEDARRIFHRISVEKTVVTAMKCHVMNIEVQRDGCAVLSNMVVGVNSQQANAVTSDILQAVVTALKIHLNELPVVASACFALCNFSYEESNVRALCRFSELGFLLERSIDFWNSDHAILVIDRLEISKAQDTILEEEIREELIVLVEESSDDPNIIGTVVRDFLFSNEWSLRLVGESLSLLRLLAKKTDTHHMVLSREMPLSKLDDYITTYEEDVRIQTEAYLLREALSTT